MASDHGRPSTDRSRGDYPGSDSGYPSDRNWQNGGSRTPDSTYRLKPTTSGSSMPGAFPGAWTDEPPPRKSGERNRSRQRNGRTASGQLRICKKCGEPLTGQFVRALDGTFHLDCFKCRVSVLGVALPLALESPPYMTNLHTLPFTPCSSSFIECTTAPVHFANTRKRRTVVKSLHPSSSQQMMRTAKGHTRFARLITFDD